MVSPVADLYEQSRRADAAVAVTQPRVSFCEAARPADAPGEDLKAILSRALVIVDAANVTGVGKPPTPTEPDSFLAPEPTGAELALRALYEQFHPDGVLIRAAELNADGRAIAPARMDAVVVPGRCKLIPWSRAPPADA